MIISSIDIGTNTILLLIAEVNIQTKKIIALHNEHRIPRIGKGVEPGKPITDEKIGTLLEILGEFHEIISTYSCNKIIISATNAFRIASNNLEVTKIIMERFGWSVDILSGDDEAQYSYLGAAFENSTIDTLVIDIGGGSTELVSGNNKKINFSKSFPIGAVIGTEKFFNNDPPTGEEIKNFEKSIYAIFDGIGKNIKTPEKAIAIAGTPTTLVCIKQNLKSYDEYLIEGSELTYSELKILTDLLSKLSAEEIRIKYGDIVNGREDVLLSGSLILLCLMEMLGLSKIIVSTKGIRYGAIIKYILNEFL